MAVKRIVANIGTADVRLVATFYEELLGLHPVMDQGWIVTLGAEGQMSPQLSIATEGGSGTPVPDLSIEVDDVAAVHARATERRLPIEYQLTDEPWGVRRFFIRDPAGRLVNILAHT